MYLIEMYLLFSIVIKPKLLDQSLAVCVNILQGYLFIVFEGLRE